MMTIEDELMMAEDDQDNPFVEVVFEMELVGPREEMDKLMAVQWNLLSKVDCGRSTDPIEWVRNGDNSMTVRYFEILPASVVAATRRAVCSVH